MACQRSTKLPQVTSQAQTPPTKVIAANLQGPGRIYLLLSLIPVLFLGTFFTSFGFWVLGIHHNSKFQTSGVAPEVREEEDGVRRYLYWGPGIDCPGKYCVHCGGLGHQESSLRCALEEALYLNRVFVLPSAMCIASMHSDLGQLRHPSHINGKPGGMETQGSAMEALYDLESMSHTVPVILSNSKEWHNALQRSIEYIHVQGVERYKLKYNLFYRQALVINRTASKLAWFVECKNRHNQSAILLPKSFLPALVAPRLRRAAEHIKLQLKDYDAIHVRRGDKVKVRKDKLGAEWTMYSHLDRDTQPESILKRIQPWIAEGRTIFIASDEKQPHYFDKLSTKYKIVRADTFSTTLQPVVQNNYQLFMVERLVLLGAKTLVKTWKEDEGDFSLSDESKKQLRQRMKPVVYLR